MKRPPSLARESLNLVRASLSTSEIRELAWLIAGMLVFAVLELFGVAAVFPFLSAVSLGQPPQDGWMRWLYDILPVQSLDEFKVALGLMFIVVLVLRNGFALFINYRLYRWIWSTAHRLSVGLLESYIQRGRAFYSDVNTSDLSARVLSETENVTSRFFLPLVRALAAALTSVLIAGGLLVVAPFTAIWGVVGLGSVYWLVSQVLKRRLAVESAGRLAANEKRFRAADEVLSGAREIRLAQATPFFMDRFAQPSRDYAVLTASNLVAGELPRFVIEGLAFIAIIGVVLAQVVASDGSVVAVLPHLGLLAVAAYRLLPSLQMLYMSVTTLRLGRESMRIVVAELAGPTAPDWGGVSPSATPHDVEREPGGQGGMTVCLRGVVYVHPTGDRGIRGVELEVSASDFVGIRGTTGSGKSTLLNVIGGFLQPQAGSYELDGIPVSEQNLDWVHRHVGYVAQEAFVFDGTIRENVALGEGATSVDERRVVEVCRLAGLQEFIDSLPGGLGYGVGQRGARLSGGQRQRLGLAQALYGQPRLLLLDEATSALDPETENRVLTALAAIDSMTIILVSHSDSALSHCRRVFKLEDGYLSQ